MRKQLDVRIVAALCALAALAGVCLRDSVQVRGLPAQLTAEDVAVIRGDKDAAARVLKQALLSESPFLAGGRVILQAWQPALLSTYVLHLAAANKCSTDALSDAALKHVASKQVVADLVLALPACSEAVGQEVNAWLRFVQA